MYVFLQKMAGGGQAPPRAPSGDIAAAWLGSGIAIALIALLERSTVGETGVLCSSAPSEPRPCLRSAL